MDNEEKLRRLRIKAEERERVREEQLQNEDSLQALREVYGLSEAELQKLQQEVEKEYAAEQASGQQRIQHRYDSWPSIKQLLITAKGRLSRGDFWLAELGVFVVHSLIAASTVSYPVLGILALICWLAHINLAIKRCHDRGYSGWFLLLGIVPVFQFWPMVELFFLAGENGENRFGSEPGESGSTDNRV